MKINFYIGILIIAIFVFSCGEGTVSVTNESYEPKIVIEGFLVPHQKVDIIRINRNFRIDENLRTTSLLPSINLTHVSIIDNDNGVEYELDFRRPAPDEEDFLENYYWFSDSDELIIDYGKSYTLDVSTRIDGKQLSANATTTVPQQGFRITQINYDSLSYRQRDENGNIKGFEIFIDRSQETTFYVVTVKPVNASTETFIYDNPYGDFSEDEVEEDLIDFSYRWGWIQDTPATAGQSKVEIFWSSLWFYSEYEVIIYAADKNYKEFLQTYNEVQEPDGNFHEPIFNIEGDGMGVFASVIPDTIYLKVLK